MVYIVHHLNASRSIRILWLLEELKIEYQLKSYTREPSGLAPKELRDLTLLGKSPVLQDGNNFIYESGVIIEYILKKHKSSLDVTEENWFKWKWAMHASEGSLMPPLVTIRLWKGIKENSPFFIRPILNAVYSKLWDLYLSPNLEGLYKQIEANMSEEGWIADNHLTAADIQMSFPLLAAFQRAGLKDKSEYPKIGKWATNVQSSPTYIKALEKCGEKSVSEL